MTVRRIGTWKDTLRRLAGASVEIGSHRGRSTRIAAVDPHVEGTEGDHRENVAHFGRSEVVQPVVAPSVTAARAWTRPVRVLVLHDATDVSPFPGPARRAGAAKPWAPWTYGARVLDGGIRLGKAWGRRRGGS